MGAGAKFTALSGLKNSLRFLGSEELVVKTSQEPFTSSVSYFSICTCLGFSLLHDFVEFSSSFLGLKFLAYN